LVLGDIVLEVSYVSDSLSFFELGFALFKVARQSLTLFLSVFAVSDVLAGAKILVR
jgi:hypothetical protein